MKKNSLFKQNRLLLYSIFIASLFLDSCEHVEEINPVIQAQQWFEKNLGNQWDAWPKNSTVQSIEWSKAITSGKVIEIPVSLENNVVGHYYNGQEGAKGNISVRLLLWLEDNTYEAAVVELVHQGGTLPSNLGQIQVSDFSGLLLANFGNGEKYATIFNKGNKIANGEHSAARTEAQYCLYFIYEHTIRNGSYTHTWIEYELQYCYDETEWQIPLPSDGGGWVLDYSGVGGGAGVQWNPGFPSAPQNGDTYEVREPSGKSTTYRYNSSTDVWEVSMVTLPATEVTAQTYPFLLNIPANFFVIGPDNLLYNYDESLMSWVARPIVENRVNTPCLRNQIEAVRANDIVTDIQQIFSDVFDNDSGNNMYSFTESLNPNYPARTFLESTNSLQLRTDLNSTLLSNASLEYTTLVIYHEIVHAILYNNGMSSELHHPTILAEYIDQLANSAISIFPNLPLQDARAIALFGLGGLANSNPTVYDQVAGQYNLNREQISETGTSYRRDNEPGNIKKGTPCN